MYLMLQFKCPNCGKGTNCNSVSSRCPHCGGSMTVRISDEMKVQSKASVRKEKVVKTNPGTCPKCGSYKDLYRHNDEYRCATCYLEN